ncbi:glycosyltransferase [candidate division KSB1 bacterium]|nr:glycosyltransferase [candidate division KSB1 bacterium]
MNNEKHVLVIAYYFPPCGMGGVQRAVKLGKYLPLYGWKVSALTVKEIAYYQKDRSLLEEIPEVNIYRSGSFDPLRIIQIFKMKKGGENLVFNSGILRRIFRFFDRYIFIPDSKLLWIPFAYLKGLGIIKHHKIQAIISTAPPFSSHLLALLLAKTFRIPLVTDFRDSWTKNDFRPEMKFIYLLLNRMLENLVLKNSQKVTCISKNILNYINERLPALGKDHSLIYNGFDDEDFPPTEKSASKFTIIIYGTVTEWADPAVFLQILIRATEINSDFKDNLDIKIIGNILDDTFQKKVSGSSIHDKFSFQGYLNHKTAVKQLILGDLLLFSISKNKSPGMITGKIFEYLAAGIPILASVPSGEAYSILKQFGKNIFFMEEGNEDEVINFLLSEFTEWGKNKANNVQSVFSPKTDSLAKFTRKNQAKAFAGILDELVI